MHHLAGLVPQRRDHRERGLMQVHVLGHVAAQLVEDQAERYRPGVLPRSSSRSAVSVVTSRCTVLLPRPSWRASSVIPSS